MGEAGRKDFPPGLGQHIKRRPGMPFIIITALSWERCRSASPPARLVCPCLHPRPTSAWSPGTGLASVSPGTGGMSWRKLAWFEVPVHLRADPNIFTHSVQLSGRELPPENPTPRRWWTVGTSSGNPSFPGMWAAAECLSWGGGEGCGGRGNKCLSC